MVFRGKREQSGSITRNTCRRKLWNWSN